LGWALRQPQRRRPQRWPSREPASRCYDHHRVSEPRSSDRLLCLEHDQQTLRRRWNISAVERQTINSHVAACFGHGDAGIGTFTDFAGVILCVRDDCMARARWSGTEAAARLRLAKAMLSVCKLSPRTRIRQSLKLKLSALTGTLPIRARSVRMEANTLELLGDPLRHIAPTLRAPSNRQNLVGLLSTLSAESASLNRQRVGRHSLSVTEPGSSRG